MTQSMRQLISYNCCYFYASELIHVITDHIILQYCKNKYKPRPQFYYSDLIPFRLVFESSPPPPLYFVPSSLLIIYRRSTDEKK